MQPNTLSIHYSVRDNDEDKILDQSRIIVPKKKGYIRFVRKFGEEIKRFFEGGRK